MLNQSVIDQMSKRFIVSGKYSLEKLEEKLEELRAEFESSRKQIFKLIEDLSTNTTSGKASQIEQMLKDRFT